MLRNRPVNSSRVLDDSPTKTGTSKEHSVGTSKRPRTHIARRKPARNPNSSPQSTSSWASAVPKSKTFVGRRSRYGIGPVPL